MDSQSLQLVYKIIGLYTLGLYCGSWPQLLWV